MKFNQFAELTGYLFFFVIVLYVAFVLVRFTKTQKENKETERKQYHKSGYYLLMGGFAGFLLSIICLNMFDGRISSEEELGIWYLTILLSTCIGSLAGFAFSGKK